MTDWEQIAAGTTPRGSLAEYANELLSATSASSEAQLQTRVETLMGKHFLGADVVRAMLKTQDIGRVAPFPGNIVEVLNSQSPVHPQGTLVKDSHLLAFIPENVSLKMLSEALGGEGGGNLATDWFMEDSIADITLSSVGQKGHWALIPNGFPLGTELAGFNASVEELKLNYGQFYTQPDVITFTTALLLNDFKNNERWYSNACAWCQDPRVGTSQENDICFGGDRKQSLFVGDFGADGLDVDGYGPDVVGSDLGCAACWNFDN